MSVVFEIFVRIALTVVAIAMIFGISIGVDALRDALARRSTPDFNRKLLPEENAWIDSFEIQLSSAAHSTRPSARVWAWSWLPFVVVCAGIIAICVMTLLPLHEWIVATLYNQSNQAVTIMAGWGGWLVGIGIWTAVFGLCIALHLAIHRREDWLRSMCLNVTMLGVDAESAHIGLMSDCLRAVCARDINIRHQPDVLPFLKAKNRFYLKAAITTFFLGFISLLCVYLSGILRPVILHTDRIVTTYALSKMATVHSFADMKSVEIDCHSHSGTPVAWVSFKSMDGSLIEIKLPDGHAHHVPAMLNAFDRNGVILKISKENECRTTCLEEFRDTSGKRALASLGLNALPRGLASD